MKKVIDKEPSVVINIEDILDYNSKIEPSRYYFALNNHIPNVITFNGSVQVDKLLEVLKTSFQVSNDHIWTSKEYNKTKKKLEIDSFVVNIRPDFIFFCSVQEYYSTILYSDNIADSQIEKLLAILRQAPEKTKAQNHIHLLYQSKGHFYLKDFEVKKIKLDVALNYNDDFVEVHQTIVKRLNKKNDKGLVMLYGKPGTGKTNYIRFLTSKIKKKLIYIPPEFTHKIASPDFLPFLISHPNSILILEDAENIVVDRGTGKNDSISNLLNLADGLLSDCLNIQIVCTFNTSIATIDKALLRKGRLIAVYEFGELEVEKAQILSNKLGYDNEIDSPMTLAEIYNQNEMHFEAQKETTKIGF